MLTENKKMAKGSGRTRQPKVLEPGYCAPHPFARGRRLPIVRRAVQPLRLRCPEQPAEPRKGHTTAYRPVLLSRKIFSVSNHNTTAHSTNYVRGSNRRVTVDTSSLAGNQYSNTPSHYPYFRELVWLTVCLKLEMNCTRQRQCPDRSTY